MNRHRRAAAGLLGCCAWSLFGLSASTASALDFKGAANADLEGRYGYVITPGDDDPRSHFGSIGIGIRGLISNTTVQYGAGLDVRLAAADSSLGTQLVLFPAGVGVTVGHRAKAGLVLGAGLSGGAGLPWTGTFPAELWFDSATGGSVWLNGYLRPSWTTASLRQNGSRLLPFFDEFEAGVKFRLAEPPNTRHSFRQLHTASGYFLALDYAEQLGSRSLSVGLGYALAATAQ